MSLADYVSLQQISVAFHKSGVPYVIPEPSNAQPCVLPVEQDYMCIIHINVKPPVIIKYHISISFTVING
jgi:hypothetical protein